MGTPAIGAQTFDYLWGTVDAVGETVEDITRPGVDGHGYRVAGERSRVTALRTMSSHATAAACDTKLTACKALVGTDAATITYMNAQTQTNTIVRSCRQVRPPQQVVSAVGGEEGGNWLLWLEFEVQHAGS